jgi:hypothetical protein
MPPQLADDEFDVAAMTDLISTNRPALSMRPRCQQGRFSTLSKIGCHSSFVNGRNARGSKTALWMKWLNRAYVLDPKLNPNIIFF